MEGLYTTARIWRIVNSDVAHDSPVGGAVLSGTVFYEGARCAFQDVVSTQALLEQGLETVKLIDCVVQPATLAIQERDELEVTAPSNHWYLGQRLRVIQVIRSSMHPSNPNAHIELKLQRVIRATRRNQ